MVVYAAYKNTTRMYTCCIHYVPFCGAMCTISIPDVYVS